MKNLIVITCLSIFSSMASAITQPDDLLVVVSNSSVVLDWENNTEPNFSSYCLYRRIGDGDFVLTATLASREDSEFIDYGFGTTQNYTYRVTVKDASSIESSAAEQTIPATTPPGTLDFSPVDSASLPNIVFFMGDDQGWGDTSYNGHPVLTTPVLDAMAADNFVFNRFYAASPNCSPTRASVLSGRTAMRSKVTNHGRYMRSHLEMTLPKALKSAGYVTGFYGKSHVGSVQPGSPVNPTGMGFDEWFIGANYFDLDPYLSRNGTIEHRDGEMGSVVVVDETIAFLERHKNGGKPMFVMAWVPAPHSPHREKSSSPAAPTFDSGYFTEIYLLDEQLGRIRQWLRDNDLEQNTIVWFMSDNGGLEEASSGGRGKKGDLWEGGLRVPAIIEWPARNLKGSTNVPVVTSDIYPTLLSLLGIVIEDQIPLDGIDVRGVIEGSQVSRSPIGFWHKFQDGQSTKSDKILRQILKKQQKNAPLPHNAARIKKDVDEVIQFSETTSEGVTAWLDWPWKLHRRTATADELYNLETDPFERNNLAADPAQASRLASMRKALFAWQASCIRSLNGADYEALAQP